MSELVNTSPVYMDYAATTPLDPAVADVMRPWLFDWVGNASAIHTIQGQKAREAIEKARQQVASCIGADADEIFFTSGATEANNMVLLGLSAHLKSTGKTHIVSSKAEHMSILEPIQSLVNTGDFEVSYASILRCGMADNHYIKPEIREKTGLISIQAVNNETGAINPLKKIKSEVSDPTIIFHVDASQAIGKIKLDVKEIGIDCATFSAHKFYGPQGVGAVYIHKDIQSFITPLFFGGGQQNSMRPGTLPTALIVGMGKACEIATEQFVNDNRRYEAFHAYILQQFLSAGIEYTILNLHSCEQKDLWRVPSIMNIRFHGIENEWLIDMVDNVSFATASACSVLGQKKSHVLQAAGLSDQEIKESVRLSFGRFTTQKDIEQLVSSFTRAILSIQSLSQAA